MNEYEKIIAQIEFEWSAFVQSERFFDEEENRKEKGKIKKWIEKVDQDQSLTKEQKKKMFDQGIQLLGEYTGCAEDLEISDEIMGALIDKQILAKESYEIFFSHSPIKRWL